jgi:glycogen debranching enzyme
MGESELAGNYGVPATPRDGADVEIIGLLYSTVKWLAEAAETRLYPFGGVRLSREGVFLSWKVSAKLDLLEFFCVFGQQ